MLVTTQLHDHSLGATTGIGTAQAAVRQDVTVPTIAAAMRP
jgi:hypothetical protein